MVGGGGVVTAFGWLGMTKVTGQVAMLMDPGTTGQGFPTANKKIANVDKQMF